MNPNFLPAFTDAFELGGDILSGVQFPPELLVIRRLRIRRLDEKAVVLPLDLIEAIAKKIQEIFIRGDDLTARGEFNDALNARDCVYFSLEFSVLEFFGSDVGRHLNNLQNGAL